MNQLQIFNHKVFGKVRALPLNNEPIFNLNDVAFSLGYTRSNTNGVLYIRKDKLINICETLDIKGVTPSVTGIQISKETDFQNTFISEADLYELTLESKAKHAREFRKWITHDVIPSIRKTGSYQIEQPKTQAEMMLLFAEQFVNQEKEIKLLKGSVDQANQKIENVSNIVSLNSVGWREKVNVILRKIAKNWTGVDPYRSVASLSYERFEKRAGCKLDIRLNNRKERAVSQGMSKSFVKKINKLDVISEEKRLVEIYIQVVKEMAIEFRVNINDFKFEDVI